MDVWRSGTFLLYSCEAAFEHKKLHQDCLISSAQLLHVPCLQSVAHLLTCGYSGNVPILHTSTQHPGIPLHVISFTRPSPTLVLQATNAGVRKPGLRFLAGEGEIDREYGSYLRETFTCSEKVFWCGSPFLDTATSQHWGQELANKHT